MIAFMCSVFALIMYARVYLPYRYPRISSRRKTGSDLIFGYALPDKPELKFREYELFKMYYCGVCKSIGRQYGHIKRFGLVNEMGMLALLLDCISGNSENTAYNVKPCIAHPFRSRLQ